jgi:hypothetical protein
MLVHAERKVLGMNAEGVETDGLKHPEAAHLLVAAVGVGSGVLEDMADVEALR